jgi:hypothetical protein
MRMGLCLRDQWRWQVHSVVVGLVLSCLYPLPIFDLELTIRFFPLLLLSSLRGHTGKHSQQCLPNRGRKRYPVDAYCGSTRSESEGVIFSAVYVYLTALQALPPETTFVLFSGHIDVRGIAVRRVQYQANQNQNHGAVGMDVGAPLC